MKTRNILSFVLAAALLSSCSLYKNYERPASIQADGIYGDALSGDSLGMGDIQWRQFFSDPTLQALIEKTLQQNSSMRQADLRIEEAQNSLKAANLAFFPSLAFAPSGTITGAIDPYNREEYKDNMGNGATKTYSFPLALNWQIDCFASLRNAKKKQEVAVENMKSVRQAVQTALVANVATMYYTLAMLDQQLAVASQTAENWKKNLEVTKLLMEAGQSNKAAVASTEANYWSICTNVVSLEQSIREMENILTALAGENPGHVSRQALTTFQTPDICTTGLPISLLSRRPDVQQAELALSTAFYNKNIAKAAFYPALTLTANGQFANSMSGVGIVNPGGLVLAAVASLTQPIFQNGKIRAAYKNSQAELEVATIGFQQTLIDAGAEVNTAMAAIKTAQAKKELIANQVKSLEDAVFATEQLMKLSSTNYLQVLTAQSSLLSAQLNQISNDYNVIANTISLYQALSGGAE